MPKEIAHDQLNLIRDYMSREPNTHHLQIDSLRNKLENQDVDINYEYQRNYILNAKEASKFVESIFLGCTIPEVQLFEEENGVIEILDGQQRILSLIKYLNNEYSLTGLSELKFLNGYYFKDLPGELCRKFKNYTLSAKLMKFSDMDDDYKYFVFERLNKGSKSLNRQEVRNCVYRGNFIEMAKRLAQRKELMEIVPDLPNDTRFERTEFVLRTLINCELFTQMKSVAGATINSYLKSHQDMTEVEIEKLEKKYMSAVNLIWEYIGINSFKRMQERGTKGSFSRLDIEALLINFYSFFNKHEVIVHCDEIKRSINNLINQEHYQSHDFHSNHRYNILGKALLMNKVLSDIIESTLPSGQRRYFTLNEKVQLWDEAKNRSGIVHCSICNNEIDSFDKAVVDHSTPYSKGGMTQLTNGRLAHSTCNLIKSDII